MTTITPDRNTPPQLPVPGKPVLSKLPTPNLADRILVVRYDARLAEHATPPAPGSKYAGPDPDRFKDFLFATSVPADQVGWQDYYYVNERLNQDEYNFQVEYPYSDPEVPRLSRTYVFLREDFSDLPPPDIDEVDSKFSNLILVESKLLRLENDPVIDSLFVGLTKVFEPRPVQTIDHELSREFGFGGTMERSQTIDRPGQELEEGLTVVDSKTTKKGLNTEILETLKLAGEDDPWLELTAGGSGYTTPPDVSFTGDAAGLGGGAATAVIAVAGAPDPDNPLTLRLKRDKFGDANGLFYWIGQTDNAGTWTNPIPTSVAITSTALAAGAIAGLTDRAASNIETNRVVHPFVIFDLGADRKLKCSGVDIRQRSDENGGTVDMSLSGSKDASTWVKLATITGSKKPNKWIHTPVDTDKFYRYLRIRGTDSQSRILTFGEVEFYGQLQFQPGGAGDQGFVSQIDIDAPGNYLTEPTVTLVGGGGSGATARSVLNGNQIGAIEVIDPGFGYGTPPIVELTGGTGAQAAATAILGFGVDHIDVDSAGSDYTIPPTVHLEGDGVGAGAVAVIGKGVESVAVTNRGTGYDTAPTVSFTGGSGSGATADAVLGFPIDSATVTDPGTGYTSAPTVTPSGGGGLGATFLALRALPLALLTLVTGGSGYTTPPTVVFTGDGSGATADAFLGFGVDTIGVDAGGSLYVTPPTVIITGDGTGAAATAVLTADAVTSIIVTAPGSGYTTAPTITFSGGGGSGAAATAVLLTSGAVISLDLTGVGADYTEAPVVSFTGGGGSGATATVTLDETVAASIGAITVVTPGSGYTTAPTLVVSGGGGSTGAATAALGTSGEVTTVTITAAGSGYGSAPDVVFTPTGTGSDAAGTATLDSAGGEIAFIAVTAAGSGYTSAPTVVIIGDGSGATATAVLEDTGSVVALTLDVPGSYVDAPSVTFSGGGGSGATAIYHLAAAWPTLYETETDPVEKIVVNVVKTLVAAGTTYPGTGYVDIKAIDKWRSVQMVSSIDLTHLPPPETVPGSYNLNLPDLLTGVAVEWAHGAHETLRIQTGFASALQSDTVSGDISISRVRGFNGSANAKIKRQFFFGAPPVAAIPCPTIIRPSSGVAVMRSSTASAQGSQGTPGGHSYIEQVIDTDERVRVVEIGNVLTGDLVGGAIGNFIGGGTSAGQTVGLGEHGWFWDGGYHTEITQGQPAYIPNGLHFVVISGVSWWAYPDGTIYPTSGGLSSGTATVSTLSADDLGIVPFTPVRVSATGGGSLSLQMPASFPTAFIANTSYLMEVKIEKWRFGLFVMHQTYVIIPDESCAPVIPVTVPSLSPLAWWPMEALI